MKYKVRIDERLYEVEVGDLQSQPIMVNVEGECFEVWTEGGPSATNDHQLASSVTGSIAPSAVAPPTVQSPRPSRRTSGAATLSPQVAENYVYAPIPGVVDSILVQAGDNVEAGQELCILEAMKMKNVIRSARSGQVAAVHVSTGEHVKHNDLLIEYAVEPGNR